MSITKLFLGFAFLASTAGLLMPYSNAEDALNNHGSMNLHRASKVIGMNVMIPKAGEASTYQGIGDVQDLVLDTKTGKVRYAAVSVGGFLGIGDKLIAVPWKAFEYSKSTDGDYFLSLKSTKAEIEAAPGFDQENWPNFGDESWTKDNDRHFHLRTPGVDVELGSNK